jgi:hypothetical protein
MYQHFIIPYLYEAQHVSGNTPTIIRSLKLHWQPLVFHTWKVFCMCRCWTLSDTVPDNIHHLHIQTTFHVWKTRGCQCSFRLLTMRGVLPETCWASYKCGIIKFYTLLHLFGFLFMNCAMMHRPTNIKCINILKYYEKFLISPQNIWRIFILWLAKLG